MAQRYVYICTACDDPCIVVSDGSPEDCISGGDCASWTKLDPVIGAALLSGLMDEQRGRR